MLFFSLEVAGRYDLDHLKKVHEHIFQDLYEWAGKERAMNFSKLDAADPEWSSRFAPHDKIRDIGESVSNDLKSWNNLKDLNQRDFAAGITAVYVKVNYIHAPISRGKRPQYTSNAVAACTKS